jgi:diguanylate cyclase (GGDEF)-like protein
MPVNIGDDFKPRLEVANEAFQRGDAHACVTEAESLHGQALQRGEWAVAADAALLLSRAHFNYFEMSGVMRWVDATLAAGQAGALKYPQARAWTIAASVHAMNDDASQAMQCLERAAVLADASVTPEQRCAMLMGAGLCYYALGMPLQAMAAFTEAIEMGSAELDAATRLLWRSNLLHAAAHAFDQLAPADTQRARQILQGVLPNLAALEADARGLGTSFAWACYCLYGGGVLLRLGQLDAAQALLEPRNWAAAPLPEWVRRERMIDLALLQRAQGDHAAAKATAQAARALNRADPSRRPRALDTLHESMLAELLGEYEQALELFKRHHAVVLRNEHVAFDDRLAELNATLLAHTLRQENAELREHNAGLSVSFKQLSHMAATDALTGITNRRGLETAYEGAKVAGRRLAMVMVDLDHFKQINDRHSHVVGDQVLRQAAKLMSEALRDADMLARFGGEEFTALLADADLDTAVVVAERLRQRVCQFDWRPLVGDVPVSVSAGLVLVQAGEDFHVAVARADVLLYRAKQGGRNRVEADTSMLPGAAAQA